MDDRLDEGLAVAGKLLREREQHFAADSIAVAREYLKRYWEIATREEFGIFREGSPTMEGRSFTQVVNRTFETFEEAQHAARALPTLRGVPHIIQSRRAPGQWHTEED